MAAFLYVDMLAVALQCDLDTAGSAVIEPSVAKTLAQGRVNGLLRVLVYGLDLSMFVGKFATVSAPVLSVSNVVVAGSDGNEIPATVQTLNPVTGLRLF